MVNVFQCQRTFSMVTGHMVTGLIHSFIYIYSVFQRSTKVDIELVIIITVGTVQNEY
jgi:hypothetical protein